MRISTIALSIICAATISVSVNAAVHTEETKDLNLNLKYPVCELKNKTAQNKINADIGELITSLKDKYYAGKLYKASTKYDITYEDDDILSLEIEVDNTANPTAVHGYCYRNGYTYNQHTGDRIPVENYLNIKDVDQLMYGIYGNVVKVINHNGTRLYASNLWKPLHVTDNYVLLGCGKVALIYKPYEISQYGNGHIYVIFDPAAIDYYNRLNNYHGDY